MFTIEKCDRVQVSRHALERLQERHKKVFGVEASNPVSEIISHLKHSEKGVPDPKRHIERLLKHKDSYCEYYTHNGWRFLIDPYKNKVVTCERVEGVEN